MSPAGDFVCLDAALQAGADAVYFGLKGSNMRAGAKNFDVAQMSKLAKLCHKKNANAYLTLNTIYYQSELSKLKSQISAAKRAGVDAVIAWDFAAISLCKELKMPVFLSTQASVSNAESVIAYFKKFEINRFVLARECSLEDMAKIKKFLAVKLGKLSKKISIEVFAHGAMCVSESGRCFMSQFSFGKSANRGECMQPCRRQYSALISENFQNAKQSGNFILDANYVMSPKDLCTLPFLDRLIDAGVDSLKIEGRNRNAEYVFETTSAYKKVRNFYVENLKGKKASATAKFLKEFEDLKKSETLRLENVFNRGFSDGFFMGKPTGDWISEGALTKKPKRILGRVLKIYPKLSVAEISIESGALKIGDEIQIEGDKSSEKGKYFRFEIESMQVDCKGISCASKGDKVAIKAPKGVKAGDRIFRF